MSSIMSSLKRPIGPDSVSMTDCDERAIVAESEILRQR
jgi:hypothetical protein